MNSRKIGLLCIALLALSTASGARAQSQSVQPDVKAFVTRYVAAFNAKDEPGLLALYSGPARACLAAEDKDFYKFALAAMWRDTIPPTYKSTVLPVNEGNLKAIESMGAHFPTKPVRELHIDYQQNEDATGVIVYLVQESGQWRADQPCPTEEATRLFHEQEPARKEREAHYKSLADAIQEPLRSELMGMIRQHQTGRAIDRYKDASGQDGQTAMLVIDQLASGPPR